MISGRYHTSRTERRAKHRPLREGCDLRKLLDIVVVDLDRSALRSPPTLRPSTPPP